MPQTCGRTDWGWLDSRHTFSFGEYHDPAHMGFRTLRVINDDRVKAGAGFGTHGHRDMEILSYVLEGALEHKDSSGGGGVIRPGEIQFMRAGTGVTHSEYNHSKIEPVHFLQIWIVPDARGLKPAYGQQAFDRDTAARGFVLLASHDGRDGSLHVHQDVDLWVRARRRGRAAGAPAAPGPPRLGPRRPRRGLGERHGARRGRRRGGERSRPPGDRRKGGVERDPGLRSRVTLPSRRVGAAGPA